MRIIKSGLLLAAADDLLIGTFLDNVALALQFHITLGLNTNAVRHKYQLHSDVALPVFLLDRLLPIINLFLSSFQ